MIFATVRSNKAVGFYSNYRFRVKFSCKSLFTGVTFPKGSATELQLLPQNGCTALAILKLFLGKGEFEGKNLFLKRVFPSSTAVYLRFTIMDVLFYYSRFKTNNQNRVIIKAFSAKDKNDKNV